MTIRFVNNSDAVGFIYWVNFDNQLQEITRLEPGKSYDEGTIPGHKWEVYDANPQEVDDPFTHLLTSYTVTEETKQCIVIARQP